MVIIDHLLHFHYQCVCLWCGRKEEEEIICYYGFGFGFLKNIKSLSQKE